MNLFPGKLNRATRNHPYTLTAEQEAWLRATFPTTENTVIAKAMGVSYPTLYYMAKHLNLEKSKEGLRAIHLRQGQQHSKMNRHERLRIMSGEKSERCKNVRAMPYTRQQVSIRHKALRRGYILPTNTADHSSDRYTIFYDDETERSSRFEANSKNKGFTFQKDET